MTIRTLAKVPLRSQPATFTEDTEDLLSNLPGWTAEVNALGVQYEADAAILAANTPSVLAAANFKGLWSGLSGALNVPAMVYHLGAYWVLAANVANVATAVPGTSSSWLALPTGNNIYNVNHGVI